MGNASYYANLKILSSPPPRLYIYYSHRNEGKTMKMPLNKHMTSYRDGDVVA